MGIVRLGDELEFPDPRQARRNGLLAVGGDVSPERLLAAYARGIFPWYDEDSPIAWFCPRPRFVLFPDDLHVPRRLARLRRQGRYAITFDRNFEAVLAGCAEPRPRQPGTWLTRDLVASMTELHRRGIAHSVEVLSDDRLVGGMYGLAIGRAFFGESMFAHVPNASKLAFVELVEHLARWEFELFDCQIASAHVERFGARTIPLEEFLSRLAEAVDRPGRPGPWTCEPESAGSAKVDGFD